MDSSAIDVIQSLDVRAIWRSTLNASTVKARRFPAIVVEKNILTNNSGYKIRKIKEIIYYVFQIINWLTVKWTMSMIH
jgi:hypothetical protein